ncbi:MAG TPA: cytochrome c [Isosphaeraceae bacterium]|jgi:mono/diheme cytochrome c family protein|nr:cytochrome c [Isosphaeraceae bacterium]
MNLYQFIFERPRRLRGGRWLLPLAVLASGCNFPGQPNPADRPLPANEVVDFQALYSQNCAGCHGADGKLGPAPPLSDPLFLAIVPDPEVYRVISAGRHGTPMPAFSVENGGTLTVAQVKALAEGLKTRWQPAPTLDEKVPPYTIAQGVDGKTSAGDKERGADVFDRACASCHGMEGEGGKQGAIHDRAFLALASDQVLRRYAITGRPDLGMPAYDGKRGRSSDFKPLSAQEITDLVALLAEWRKESPAHGEESRVGAADLGLASLRRRRPVGTQR